MKKDPAIGGRYYPDMTKVEKVRSEAMTLSASERARLAHELILSLDDPDDCELSPAQETEIQRLRSASSGGSLWCGFARMPNACVPPSRET